MAPESPFRRFASFMAEVATITADLVGADRVDLRSIERLPRGEKNVAGAASIWRGHMDVGHDVPGFIEALLAHGPTALTPARLDHLREMLGTLLHESIHLALPNEYIPELALVPGSYGDVFLEEGVTEAATQALLPRMLARLESTFPGVSREAPDRTGHYPNYVPATRELLSVVSGLPEMQGRDALKELARVGPQRKFDLLVEQAMEGFGLTFNVPARDRNEVRSRIRAALEAHVERNLGWMVPRDPTNPGRIETREPHALSTIMGKQMRMELLRQLHAEGERFHMDLPEGWRQELSMEELRTAGELRRDSNFTGPEAEQALESWIRTAKSEIHKPQSPAISPGEDWPRRAQFHHRRRPWPRYEQARRGMTR